MNIRTKNTLSKLAPYVLLFLIVTAILFTVYAVKGIFPFGDGSITYADFAQSYVPQFYHYWDVLHGMKNPFFDWYSGTGVSMVSTDMFSPFNLFLLFVPREGILDSMSFFLALKVVVSAITCYIFINRVFRNIDIGYKLGFSVLYSMSGYVLQYYSNIKWLDIVAIFPLLMLGFYYLMKKEKILLYAISLTIIMLENFYISVQVIIFLLFTGGLYIIVMAGKNEKKYKAFSLALGTVIGIGLSMFKTLPTFLTLMGSSRGEGNANKGYFDIINVVFKDTLTTNDMNKWFMLMGLELAVILCVVLIARFIKHKRATLFFVGEALILCLPIFFEGVNKLWHTGSYVGFPMRSAFTIVFLFIVGACYCVDFENRYQLSRKLPCEPLCAVNNDDILTVVKDKTGNIQDTLDPSIEDNINTAMENKPNILIRIKIAFFKIRKNPLVTVVICFVAVALVCFAVPWLLEASSLIKRYGSYFLNTQDFIIPKLYLRSAILIIIAFILILLVKKSKIKNICIVLAIIIPLSVNTYSFIGAEKYVYAEQNPKFVKDAESVAVALPESENVLDRVKNADNSLNTNYPFIIQHGALCNWTHTVSADAISAMKSMGYSSSYTRLLDTGGTLLTDSIMGIKSVITKDVLTDPAYTFVQSVGEFNCHNYNYSLPTGLVTKSDITDINTGSAEISKTNNLLYHSLSDDTENIMEVLGTSSTLGCFYNVTKTDQTITYNVKITGNKMIYFKSGKKNISIKFNGTDVKVPTYLSEDRVIYPSEFNNNVIPVGYVSDKVVSVQVTGSSLAENDVILYVFDVDKLTNLCQNYNASYNYSVSTGSSSLSATVTTQNDSEMFFVPVCYDKGWSATVNGKPVKLEPALNDGFMAIPLENGQNEITMSYFPNGMKTGILITVVVLALLVIVLYLGRKKNITRPPQAVAVVAKGMLYIIWTLAIIGVYIIPIVYELFFATGK